MNDRYKCNFGNCMDFEIPKAKLLLTDIPYGEVTRDDNGWWWCGTINKFNADKETFVLADFLKHIYDSIDIFIIFCGMEQFSEIYSFFNKKQNNGLGSIRQLIWAKTNPSPMNGEYVYLSATETAVWFKKKGTGKLNSTKCKKNYFVHGAGSSKLHPTEKNHELLQELILDNTDENDLVVDTCMGSGSTGVVALKNQRRFYGIEYNKNYFKLADERIKDISDSGIFSPKRINLFDV